MTAFLTLIFLLIYAMGLVRSTSKTCSQEPFKHLVEVELTYVKSTVPWFLVNLQSSAPLTTIHIPVIPTMPSRPLCLGVVTPHLLIIFFLVLYIFSYNHQYSMVFSNLLKMISYFLSQ